MQNSSTPPVFPHLPAGLAKQAEKILLRVPAMKHRIDTETSKMLSDIEPSLKPYRGKFPTHTYLPKKGLAAAEILKPLLEQSALEQNRWKDGFVSGAVYHGSSEHIEFLNEICALFSQTNPLHSDLFPSVVEAENQIIRMAAELFQDKNAVGSITSGGTESILLAMKAYRDHARETRGIDQPEMITSVTAHAAFEKAAHYFGIKHVKIPLEKDYSLDPKKVARAVTSDTICIVGSAPHFPHGLIDPIEELSKIAAKHGIGMHVDACLGGFILPFAKELGANVPAFDFSLPGVTSISADTHKYGYAPKGSSIVLYRSPEVRMQQFFVSTDWPGGMYFSPTLSGSRPGALIVGCLAAMLKMGRDGYVQSTRKILAAADVIKQGIRSIPDLQIIGDPLFVVAFRSDTLDIYQVLDQLSKLGWNLNGLHKPAAIHIAVTLRHAEAGVVERFVRDLRTSVDLVRGNPQPNEGLAPIYGMAGSLPFRGIVGDLLRKYLDRLYR